MSGTNFLPSREADLTIWSATFSAWITATPLLVGLTAAQALTFKNLNDAWALAFAKANSGETNSDSAREAKDTAKIALKDEARLLAGIIQKFPGTTDQQRAALGLTVPNPTPSPIPAPVDAPNFRSIKTNGWTLSVKIQGADTERRGKPAGCQGAIVWTWIGDTNPPTDIREWSCEGPVTRTNFDVKMPSTLAPLTKMWLTACWYSPRGVIGPLTPPVATRVGEGVSKVG